STKTYIVEWVRHHGGEWTTQTYANTQGKQLIVNLHEVIWYIDMRGHKKFKDRSYHIPELFLEFFNRASPESYKEARKPFDQQELNLHCSALAPYATSSWMLKENFSWLRNAFDNFIVAISNYTKYLQNQRSITAMNHTSETPVRTVEQATTIQIHKQNFWVTPIDKTKYFHLEQVLTELPLWKPVDIEEFLPTDPVWRIQIQLRNNAFNAISIWKIDEHANEEKTLRENNRIISELQAEAPVIIHRQCE
ncbi:17150_t:CDS:2, partial [Gigaspora rosea]